LLRSAGPFSLRAVMPPPPRRTVQLEAKVLAARGLVSSKGEGEPCTSSCSLVLFGDEAASEPVPETNEPTYECSKVALVKADDTGCAKLLTSPLSVSILEGARKKPTSLTCERAAAASPSLAPDAAPCLHVLLQVRSDSGARRFRSNR
jgi:hypothetical protein